MALVQEKVGIELPSFLSLNFSLTFGQNGLVDQGGPSWGLPVSHLAHPGRIIPPGKARCQGSESPLLGGNLNVYLACAAPEKAWGWAARDDRPCCCHDVVVSSPPILSFRAAFRVIPRRSRGISLFGFGGKRKNPTLCLSCHPEPMAKDLSLRTQAGLVAGSGKGFHCIPEQPTSLNQGEMFRCAQHDRERTT